MSFIGIVSNNKSFELLKEKILQNENDLKLSLIHINLKSIENIKNIKFETIIINDDLKKFENQEKVIEQICSEAKYIIINTDINFTSNILAQNQEKVITFGLNTKATVTISSITENGILICLQKNITNIKNKVLEVEEKRVKILKGKQFKTYEILILYIIFSIYDYAIINEI